MRTRSEVNPGQEIKCPLSIARMKVDTTGENHAAYKKVTNSSCVLSLRIITLSCRFEIDAIANDLFAIHLVFLELNCFH